MSTPWSPVLAQLGDPSRASEDPADRNRFGALHPSLVVWPHDAAEVQGVLTAAGAQRLQVAVIGAGTRASRCWTAPPPRPHIALVSTRMDAILRIDATACLVQSQAGVRIAALEVALNRHGLTLGPLAGSVSEQTVGGVLAAPPAEANQPDGAFTDKCFALCAITPSGLEVQTRPVPRAAAGPHLGRLFLNSQGSLGVITSATLGVSKIPEHQQCCAFGFSDLRAAYAMARTTIDAGVGPAALRLCLTAETCRGLTGLAGNAPSRAVIVLLTGQRALVQSQQGFLQALAERNDGSALELPADFDWRRQRDAHTPAERVHAALSHSDADTLVPALAAAGEQAPLLWIDQFGRHGANLWAGAATGAESPTALFRRLDLPAAPGSCATHPLLGTLRQALDPGQTLAVPRSLPKEDEQQAEQRDE